MRLEFERGTVVIVVNMAPDELAPLVDPGIADVATVNETLRAPFYTLIAKNEEQCQTGLQPGCGAYSVEARNFTGFSDLANHAREALNVRLRAPFDADRGSRCRRGETGVRLPSCLRNDLRVFSEQRLRYP